MRLVPALAATVLLALPALGQDQNSIPEELRYKSGEKVPRPTPAQLDTLLLRGLVPTPLENGALRGMYWPRAGYVVAARTTHSKYMTQALRGGFGVEADAAMPFGPTDHGWFVYGRYNHYQVLDARWLGWPVGDDLRGLVYGIGGGLNLALPMRHPQASFPAGVSIGAQVFKGSDGSPAQTYISFQPSLGFRYRLMPAVAALARLQPTWMFAMSDANRNIGVWGLSLGLELSLDLDPHRPVQTWAPPLVVNAQDVVKLLTTSLVSPVNLFDRNLDFINTELKPLTALGWYDLGFYGEVRGTVMASSRASSGNVTALDIRIDSADRRGFRVTRNASMIDPEFAAAQLATSLLPPDSSTIVADREAMERLRRGEYAFRSPDELGVRFIRIELFPQAKGPLNLIPSIGSRVVIKGDLRWDGDGHMELHPRKPADTRIVTGEFLNSDDPVQLE